MGKKYYRVTDDRHFQDSGWISEETLRELRRKAAQEGFKIRIIDTKEYGTPPASVKKGR